MPSRAIPKSMTTVLRILAVLGLISGCAGLKSDRDIAWERAKTYLAAHPNTDAKTAAAIRSNSIHKGMTMEQVIAAWGRPAAVEKYRDGAVQHWFFGCDYPHTCDTQERLGGRGVLATPDQIYVSNALFQDGVVVEWSS